MADEVIETCAACGFDGSRLQPPDAVVALRSLRRRWTEMIDGVDPALLVERPAPGVWSAAEYAAHSAIVTGFWAFAMHRALTEPAPDIALGAVDDRDAPAVGPPDVSIDTVAMVDDLGRHADAMAAEAAHVDPAGWGREGSIDGQPFTALYALRHAVHDATHHLRDVERGLSALGARKG